MPKATDAQLRDLADQAERDIRAKGPLESQLVAANLLSVICHELAAWRRSNPNSEYSIAHGGCIVTTTVVDVR